MMIKIIDNFFKDPYAVRNLASSTDLKYEHASNGKWPGVRVEISGSQKIAYSRQYQKFFDEPAEAQNMFFQSIGELWGTGSIHHDHESKYTVLTFLNLRYPSNSGIEIYNKRTTEDHRWAASFQSTKVGFYLSSKNPIERFFFEKKLKLYNSHFEDPCIVSNRFNRTVIFSGSRIHRAQNFFGNNLSNSRLTMISFFG